MAFIGSMDRVVMSKIRVPFPSRRGRKYSLLAHQQQGCGEPSHVSGKSLELPEFEGRPDHLGAVRSKTRSLRISVLWEEVASKLVPEGWV